jgi:hypothetical protein
MRKLSNILQHNKVGKMDKYYSWKFSQKQARPEMASPNSIHPYISPQKKIAQKRKKKERYPKPYFLTKPTV